MPKLLSAFFFLAFAAGGMYAQLPLCAINPSTGEPKNCCNATSFADCQMGRLFKIYVEGAFTRNSSEWAQIKNLEFRDLRRK